MTSGFVVRLQNLPWSASAPDVRDFFCGLEIPNGGVRIIGGDDGDCFISFMDGRDARDALRKNGSYLKDQAVRLHASSEEEMQYVIAIAKGENPPKPRSMYGRNEDSNRKRTGSPSRRDEPPHKQDRGGNGYSANSERQNRDRPWNDSNQQTNSSRYDSNTAPQYSNGNSLPPPAQQKFYQDGSNQPYQQPGFPDKQNQPPWSDSSANPSPMAAGHSGFSQSNSNSGRQPENQFLPNNFGGFQKQGSLPQGNDMSNRGEGQRDHEIPSQERNRSNRNFNRDNSARQSGSASQGTRSDLFEDRFQSAAPTRDGPGNDRSDSSSWRNSRDDHTFNQQISFPSEAGSNRTASFGPQYSNIQGGTSSGLPPPTKNPGPAANSRNEFMGPRTNSSRDQSSNNENRNAWFNSERSQSSNQFHGSAQPASDATSPNDRFGAFTGRQFSDVDERHSQNSYDRSRSQEFSETRRSRFDRDDHADSDLRNARMDSQRRPAGPSKSAALLPTPDLPPEVKSLLDVNVSGPSSNSWGPGVHSNMSADFPLPPQGASFRGPPGTPDSHGPPDLFSPHEGPGNPFPRPDNFQNYPQGGSAGDMPMHQGDTQGLPAGMGMLSASQAMPPKPIIAITDPAAYFSNLPGDVTFKQMRGLFATHNIIAKDIKINWPQDRWKGIAEAVVLFEGIDTTVKALNELSGMRISGKVFNIEPCPVSKYENFQSNELMKGSRRAPPSSDSSNVPSRDGRSDSRPAGRFEGRLGGRMGDRLGNKVTDRDDRRRRDSFRRSPDRSRPRRSSRSPPRRRSSSPRRAPFRERRRSPVNTGRDDRGGGRPAMTDKRSDATGSGEQGRSTSGQQSPPKNTTESASSSPARCAVLSGLPAKAAHRDLEQFLTDSEHDSSSLYIEFNVHGECTGTAYVELLTDQSLKSLMNSSKKFMNQTIQVSAVSKEQMAKSVDDHVKKLAADKTKPGEFILQLVGLPVDTTPKVVCEFLYPTKVVDSDVTIVKAVGSTRWIGTAFVKVHSLVDKEEAVKHDRGYIGKRYVTVRVVNERFMADFVSKIGGRPQASETKGPASQSNSRTIKMANVRYDVKPAELETFFKDYNPEPGSVNFSMVNGMPNGRGTIRMATSADAEKAVKELNKLALGGRPLLLSVLRS